MTGDRDRREGKRWRTASQIHQEFAGGTPRTNRLLTELKSTLIRDIVDQTNIPAEAATRIVEHNLIRYLGPGERRGKKAILATDDAVRMLDLDTKAEKQWRSRLIKEIRSSQKCRGE